MAESLQVLAFVVVCLGAAVATGMLLGYGIATRRLKGRLEDERGRTLDALHAVLKSADDISVGVGAHTRDLVSVEERVTNMDSEADIEEIQSVIIQQICDVVEANKKLEDDLVCTKYELQQQEDELDRTRLEARTDALSGTGNRKAFEEHLPFMISRAKRDNDPFGMLLIDVDHFKWINDTHGHHAGDQVIALIGESLRGILRPRDYVARYGGDEFAVMLADVDLRGGIEAGQRIRRAIDQTNFDCGKNGARIAVTFSIGLAMVEHDDTPESLLQKADAALYESKRKGRNQLNWYEGSPAYS